MDKEKIFFTSDTHLGHENIIRYEKRPFKDLDEMDDYFVSKVLELPGGSQLYIIGDFCFDIERALKVLSKIPKNIFLHLIRGNHDYDNIVRKIGGYFASMNHIKEVKVSKREYLFLCHYPMLSWNKSHWGSIQLHGHHHINLWDNVLIKPLENNLKSMNVCWGLNNFEFVTYEQVLQHVNNKTSWNFINKGDT